MCCGDYSKGCFCLRYDDLRWVMSRSIVITGLWFAAGVPQYAVHDVRDIDSFTGQHAGQ